MNLLDVLFSIKSAKVILIGFDFQEYNLNKVTKIFAQKDYPENDVCFNLITSSSKPNLHLEVKSRCVLELDNDRVETTFIERLPIVSQNKLMTDKLWFDFSGFGIVDYEYLLGLGLVRKGVDVDKNPVCLDLTQFDRFTDKVYSIDDLKDLAIRMYHNKANIKILNSFKDASTGYKSILEEKYGYEKANYLKDKFGITDLGYYPKSEYKKYEGMEVNLKFKGDSLPKIVDVLDKEKLNDFHKFVKDRYNEIKTNIDNLKVVKKSEYIDFGLYNLTQERIKLDREYCYMIFALINSDMESISENNFKVEIKR